MNNRQIVVELDKIIQSDVLDRDEVIALQRASYLLKCSVAALLSSGYRAGFLDGIQQGTRGANIHVRAQQNADAYALKVLRAHEKQVD